MISPPPEGAAGTDFRLARDERMRTDREFREVVHRGERTRTPHFTVYRDRRGTGRKFGVSAGRRVGRAVVRNRLKRLIREFFRLNKSVFPPGTRTAIVVRELLPETGLRRVQEELLAAIESRWGKGGSAPPCGPETSS